MDVSVLRARSGSEPAERRRLPIATGLRGLCADSQRVRTPANRLKSSPGVYAEAITESEVRDMSNDNWCSEHSQYAHNCTDCIAAKSLSTCRTPSMRRDSNSLTWLFTDEFGSLWRLKPIGTPDLPFVIILELRGSASGAPDRATDSDSESTGTSECPHCHTLQGLTHPGWCTYGEPRD
jgi:hypothetical protein